LKTLLLKKETRSSWVSCQSITRNLTLVYKYLLKDELSVWDYDESHSFYEVRRLAKRIKDSGFEQVVWVDHHPHPQKLLKALDKEFFENTIKPNLNFHLFGDFSLFAPRWKNCSSLLKNFSVRFFCASYNQADFVKSFLKESENVFIFPFPVDESSFGFSQEERMNWRNKYKIGNNDKIILYTGRLSVQKNVVEMIRVFSRVKSLMGESDIRLFVAGPMDDLGLPFVGKRGLPGSYFRIWHKEWTLQNELVDKKQIVYLGEQDSAQLNASYCGADLFCSLSTHNDEDYGMSVAEAACTGLPLLLSQWGGFPDFVNLQREANIYSNLVPVDLDSGARPLPLWDMAQKKMFSLLNQTPLELEKRDACAKTAQKKLGVTALAGRLKQAYREESSKFKGFNENFSKFCSAFEARPKAPFANIKGEYNDLYKRSYKPYIKRGDIK
jgi:glycosyltransferase involved in cell wall biosynthesis